MAGRQPIRRVRVVVVDHDGGAMTLRCIESLHASTWDGEQDIVLVDNASSAPVVDEVARRWPDVRVVRCARNLGFAGGANAGIGDLRDVDAVALVNNDAVVRAGWLAPLVAALEHDDRVGAACPKILLSGRYVEVAIASPATHRRRLDRRPLGVRLHDVHAPGGAFHLARGFWGPERGRGGEHQWTNGDARLFAAVGGGDDAAVVRVLLSANGPVPAQVCAGGVDIDAPTAATSRSTAASTTGARSSRRGAAARCCSPPITSGRAVASTSGCSCTTRTSTWRCAAVVAGGGSCSCPTAWSTTITPPPP